MFASVPTQPPQLSLEEERLLRVAADLRAIESVADHPRMAPGKSWALLSLIAATALLSLAVMTLLWNLPVAALILAAVGFHEAGHATAMWLLGYRDVRIFFIPLLGAVTVGRPTLSNTRDRLIVLLAGPVPGLWLAVGLLALDLRPAALALLILNGLNLLPFTPLDGGRALEAMTRPESVWRPAVHGLSALGLLGIGAFLGDPAIAAVGVFWALLWPRQLAGYRLRRSIAAQLQGTATLVGVARAALQLIAGWRAAARQVTARSMARLFTESAATPADRGWGVLAYLWAWIPVVAALMLWSR